MNHRRIFGDCRESLTGLEPGSVQCCITSPPYWGLRSYLPVDHPLKAREIGAEKTPEGFVAALVDVFRGVRRVLRDDGVLWLNLGDTYLDKQLLLIPYRVAMALQADGWYLRASIPWVKANVMPASVTDRPTVAHESIFLLTKSARYFYDVDAVRVGLSDVSLAQIDKFNRDGVRPGQRAKAHIEGQTDHTGGTAGVGRGSRGAAMNPAGRNRRTSDWWNESIALAIEELQAAQAGGLFHDADGAPLGLNVNTKPYPGAHFAVFPPKLAEPCVKAGTSERGCCPDCLAPWVRVVERSTVAPAERPTNKPIRRLAASDAGQGQTALANSTLGMVGVTRTTGFRPTCQCPEKDPVPCTILDPFGGSGTTAQVAEKLGRDSIVCELDERCDALMDDRLGKQLTLAGAA